MFLTPHTSAALWVSTRINDPFLAFAAGIISHFILDIIPHGDEGLAKHKLSKRERLIYLSKVAIVDTILSVALIYIYLIRRPDIDRMTVSAAVLGAWAPDLAWIAIESLKLKFMDWYIKFHGSIHRMIDWHYSLVYGVPFQIVVTLFIVRTTF